METLLHCFQPSLMIELGAEMASCGVNFSSAHVDLLCRGYRRLGMERELLRGMQLLEDMKKVEEREGEKRG
jgi:hypothetical protein